MPDIKELLKLIRAESNNYPDDDWSVGRNDAVKTCIEIIETWAASGTTQA